MEEREKIRTELAEGFAQLKAFGKAPSDEKFLVIDKLMKLLRRENELLNSMIRNQIF